MQCGKNDFQALSTKIIIGKFSIAERVASVLYDSFPSQFVFFVKQLLENQLNKKPVWH